MTLPDPRPHHYRFAHRALASIALQHGQAFPDMASAGELDAALDATWAEVGEELEPDERLSPLGLSSSLHDGIVLVTMPPAVGAVEAVFVAVVPLVDEVRYLTLELDASGSGTMLGAWSSEGHLNIGTGPAPTPAAFLDAVRALLSAPAADTVESRVFPPLDGFGYAAMGEDVLRQLAGAAVSDPRVAPHVQEVFGRFIGRGAPSPDAAAFGIFFAEVDGLVDVIAAGLAQDAVEVEIRGEPFYGYGDEHGNRYLGLATPRLALYFVGEDDQRIAAAATAVVTAWQGG